MRSVYKPPDRGKLRKEFNAKALLYKSLIDEVVFCLNQELKAHEIKVNGNIQGRVKTFESFYHKIVRKQIKEKPFTAIRDIAGVRVVCLYRRDLENIGHIINENFEVLFADIKTQKSRSSEFGYLSDHYIVKISKKCQGPRYNQLRDIKCEIQVRTILMDAWDSVSHHLDYKQEIDIPTNLRKDFYALSGLFYIADTHFEMFLDSVQSLKAGLEASVEKDDFNLKQEMNLTTLLAYLDWKLPARDWGDKRDYSGLLKELEATGYNDLIKLNQSLDRTIDAVEAYEKDDPPTQTIGKKTVKIWYSKVGIVRVALEMLDSNYLKYTTSKEPDLYEALTELYQKYKPLIK